MLHQTEQLTVAQQRKMMALANRPTRYEIEVIRPDKHTVRLPYTARRSFRGLCLMVEAYGQEIVTFLGLPKDATCQPSGVGFAKHFVVDGGGLIRFTGRTQRDAIMSGTELAHISKRVGGASVAPELVAV